jgi:hypothetical protein
VILNQEIDDVGAARKRNSRTCGKTKGKQAEYKDEIDDLKGSIIDLKAKEIRKEEERRDLSQACLAQQPSDGIF